ncbi:MAG: protein translocase subunit SecF [Bacteriovoracaceae bacterium]|nr:protein translocase subunit SecF [Bacteriovoracaceae bacterium]
MFQLIKVGTNIDFMGKMKYIAFGSLIVCLISIWGIINKMNYGVDFRGGAEIQVKFSQSVGTDELRNSLSTSGFQGVSVQTIGEPSENNVLVKVQAKDTELNLVTEGVTKALQTSFVGNTVTVEKVDIVGPKAGAELRSSAIKAMFWAIISIMIYIGVRFDFRYAPGTMLSIIHDLLVICGVLAFTGMEFSLQIVGALLALIGYSVNDTVVIYDRIREYETKNPNKSLIQNINDAVNDTLSRTIITALATFIVCLSMYFLGGGAIKDFFFVLSVGILLGTYSTVYIAAGVVVTSDLISKKMGSKNTNATNVTA